MSRPTISNSSSGTRAEDHPLSPGRTTASRTTHRNVRKSALSQDQHTNGPTTPVASSHDPTSSTITSISASSASAASTSRPSVQSSRSTRPSSLAAPQPHPKPSPHNPHSTPVVHPPSTSENATYAKSTSASPLPPTHDVKRAASEPFRPLTLTPYEGEILYARYDLLTERQLEDALRPWSSGQMLVCDVRGKEVEEGREPLFPDDSPTESLFPEARKEHPLRVLARLAWVMWEMGGLREGQMFSSREGVIPAAGLYSRSLSLDLHDALASSLPAPTPPPSLPVPSSSQEAESSIKSRVRSTSTVSSSTTTETDLPPEPSSRGTSIHSVGRKSRGKGREVAEGTSSLRDRSRSIGERYGSETGGKAGPGVGKNRASTGSWIGIGKSGLFGWGNRGPSVPPTSSTTTTIDSSDSAGLPSIDSIGPSAITTTSPTGTHLSLPSSFSSDPSLPPASVKGDRTEPNSFPVSSPLHFKAIFLSTRLLTSDPSSLLSDPSATTPYIARLVFELVTNARSQNISVREAPSRPATSRRQTRRLSIPLLPETSDQISSDSVKPSQVFFDNPAAERGQTSTPSSARPNSYSSASSVLSRLLLGKSAPRASQLQHHTSHPAEASSSSFSPSLATACSTEAPPVRSVELEPIEPVESKPPTSQLSRSNLEDLFSSSKTRKKKTASRFRTGGRSGRGQPLTDRYGFIYDVANIQMLREASEIGNPAPSQFAGLPHSSRRGEIDHDDFEEEDDWVEQNIKPLDRPIIVSRSSAPFPLENRHNITLNHQPSSQPASLSPSGSGARSSLTLSPSSDKDRELPSSTILSTSPRSTSSSSQTKAKTRRRRSSTLISIEPSPAQPTTASVQSLHISAQEPSLDVLLSSSSPSPSSNSIPSDQPFSLVQPPTRSSSSSFASSAIGKQRTIEILLNSLVATHAKLDEARLLAWKAFFRSHERERALAASSSSYHDDAPSFLGFDTMSTSSPETYRSFLTLVRKGIPVVYRSKTWAECSGATTLFVPGVYEELLSKAMKEGLESTVVAEIEKDVVRTLPSNSFFGGDGPGVVKLRNILYATAWRELATGYCQGLNMIAATLLLIHTEVEAFHVLNAILSSPRLCPPHYYSADLLGSRADQSVLVDLVALELPKLAAHAEELGAELPAITFSWFLSLFTDCLPVETLFRLWDVYFVEGFDLWFRIALVILKLNETILLETESVGDLYNAISTCTARLWNPDLLLSMESHLQAAVTSDFISSRRAFHLRRLREETHDT